MASIKKKSSGGGGGANWMDTYGDMVTLLLCFFVLLYSISSIDQTKWMLVVQSFNRNAVVNPEQTVPGPTDDPDNKTGGNEMPATDDVEKALDTLYQYLKQNVASDSISVSQGDGYVFISFADAVFFDGNSFTLKPEGKAVLDQIIPALTAACPYVDELEVLGHTAQQYANTPNPIENDRRLSSNRADSVVIYLQERIPSDVLDPGRLVSTGHGQWRNVSPTDTEAHRAKNRRVEMVVTGKNLEDMLSDSLTQYSTMYKTATDGTTTE